MTCGVTASAPQAGPGRRLTAERSRSKLQVKEGVEDWKKGLLFIRNYA